MTAYFIDTLFGNNGNPGTAGAAWLDFTPLNTATLGPDDSITLTSGQTLNDQMWIVGQNGSLGHPITLRTSSSGRAIVEQGTGWGGILQNCSHWKVDNIQFFGATVGHSGTFPTKQSTCANIDGGLLLYNTSDTVVSQDIEVTNCAFPGHRMGVFAFTAAPTTPTVGFDNIWVHGNEFNDIMWCGFFHAIRGSGGSSVHTGIYSTNLIVEDNLFYEIWGNYNENSAYAVSLNETDSTCIVRHNFCRDNGESSNQGGGGNGVSLFLLDCNGTQLLANEIARHRTPSGVDGSGIDIEASANCFAAGNLIYDCDGMALEAGSSGSP